MTNIEYACGFYDLGDLIVNHLNSLDSSEITTKELRSEIVKFILEAKLNDARRHFNETEDTF